ncbi:MAG: hypothetical protein ACJAQT_003409 [Akkermansiaceae bacterium]|jgi:hypothetical protein
MIGFDINLDIKVASVFASGPQQKEKDKKP